MSLSLGVATKTKLNESFNDVLQAADKQMYGIKNLKKKDLDKQFILAIKRIIYNKLPELEEEAKGWAKISQKIGKIIELSEKELKKLELLVNFSEIGKIGFDQSILEKEASDLSAEEIKEFKKYPEIGYRIAKATPSLKEIAELILSQQENWDGSGYPKGLSGEQIPLLSRILALAKFFAQLRQGNNGKKRDKPDQIAVLKKVAGLRFDPELVRVLIHLLQEEERDESL